MRASAPYRPPLPHVQHTILVFNGTVASGKAAALNLHVRLLGDPRPFFSGAAVSGVSPAHHGGGSTKPPTDLSPFGDVPFESLSHPSLSSASASCAKPCRPAVACAMRANASKPAS